jgi:replicative DNA helicase
MDNNVGPKHQVIDSAQHVSDQLDKVISTFGHQRKGIPTSMKKLDEYLNGLEPNDFIIIAGRPSMGKSAFSTTMALAASVNHKVLLLSLEMEYTRICERLLSTLARVDNKRMVQNKLKSSEQAAVRRAAETLKHRNLIVDDSPMLTTDILKFKLRSLKDVDVVIIDYLQLMKGNRPEGRQQEISDISRELKLIAKEFSIPVIALCQLNRQCEYREDPRPRASDLRESGSLEQDADKIILIHRPSYFEVQASHTSEDDDGEAELIIGKNRHGPCEIVKCAFMPEWVGFVDSEYIEDF